MFKEFRANYRFLNPSVRKGLTDVTKSRITGEDYILRFEAKRLLVNLEKFREVELDFKSVKQPGQGFTDEVIRIFVEKILN